MAWSDAARAASAEMRRRKKAGQNWRVSTEERVGGLRIQSDGIAALLRRRQDALGKVGTKAEFIKSGQIVKIKSSSTMIGNRYSFPASPMRAKPRQSGFKVVGARTGVDQFASRQDAARYLVGQGFRLRRKT